MLQASCRTRPLLLLANCRYYKKEAEVKTIDKILVVNRGDIAIRIFAACAELGIKSVAIYSQEDRVLSHKLKADESYLIGAGQNPAKAYTNISEILRVCMHSGVDAVHPGHGFLAERADFADSVIRAGLKYIGPPVPVLDKLGNKVKAKAIAKSLQIPTVPGTDKSIRNLDEAKMFLKRVGVPVIVKPTFGSQGKCIQLVDDPTKLNETLEAVVKEAREHFGDGRVYLEKFLNKVRHIEVQIMFDSMGNSIHLFDRNCSIQSKFTKLCEIAPAPNLSEKLRNELIKVSLQMAQHIEFENVGSFEFLVNDADEFYFMEANACLSVEHAITEEVTGIDLVHSQIKIAEGRTLKDDLKLTQDRIAANGSAIQCRITTEDPKENFYPDIGKIDVFQVGAGPGIRIDCAHGFIGASISPHFDPLLLKLTARANTFRAAARKMRRALSEFSVRGVKTNLEFLIKVLENRNFQAEKITTSFIAENPTLFNYKVHRYRIQSVTTYLGEILVNGPMTPFYTNHKPHNIKPIVPYSRTDPPPQGLRDLLKTKGIPAFLHAVKSNKGVLLVDGTFRDANETLLVGRVRTYDLLKIAPYVAQNFSNLFAVEVWGGATFDVALRFLYECPWQRLVQLRKMIPNIPFQMLIRGSSIVGYNNYPDNVIYKFCNMAAKAGIDVFRIYDALNYLPHLKVGIDAVQKAGGVAAGCLTYSGDIGDPKKVKYTLDYYLKLADELVRYGAHILCINDPAGLLKPKPAGLLVSTLKQKFPDIPLHIHTHDTGGNGVATSLACAFAGVNILDVAVDTMSGITGQPSMGAVVAALKDTGADTKINLHALPKYSAYWEQTRTLYAPFECTSTMKSGNADVYLNEIPGAQYINLHFQAYSYGAGDHFEDIKRAYTEANLLLGDLIKAFPVSTVVADLAHFMVQNKLSAQDILDKAEDLVLPSSVVTFFLGDMGEPYQGYPEPLRSKVIRGMKPFEGRPGAALPPVDFANLEAQLKNSYDDISEYDVMTAAIFPHTARKFFEFRLKYGPVDSLETRIFFVGPQIGEEFAVNFEDGSSFDLKILAISNMRTSEGERVVFYELNGTLRSTQVFDKKAGQQVVINPKADKGNKYHIGAPAQGILIQVKVKPGDIVEKRFPLAVLSTMKTETTIFCPFSCIIKEVHIPIGAHVEIGDLIITLE